MAENTSSLISSFGIHGGECVIALVGAGGKTSLMYALAREMAARHEEVVTTTTTKIFPPRPDQSSCLMLVHEDPTLELLAENLSRWGHVTVGQCLLPVGKLEGISDTTIGVCMRYADRVLIEADGSAGRPVKAPEAWEPVIPNIADVVIPVVGLDCLGRPATDEWVFRLDRFLEVTGLKEGQAIDAPSIARLLTHSAGALSRVPETARVVPFLNKTDQLADEQELHELVREISLHASGRISLVVAGKLVGGMAVRAFALTSTGFRRGEDAGGELFAESSQPAPLFKNS